MIKIETSLSRMFQESRGNVYHNTCHATRLILSHVSYHKPRSKSNKYNYPRVYKLMPSLQMTEDGMSYTNLPIVSSLSPKTCLRFKWPRMVWVTQTYQLFHRSPQRHVSASNDRGWYELHKLTNSFIALPKDMSPFWMTEDCMCRTAVHCHFAADFPGKGATSGFVSVLRRQLDLDVFGRSYWQ